MKWTPQSIIGLETNKHLLEVSTVIIVGCNIIITIIIIISAWVVACPTTMAKLLGAFVTVLMKFKDVWAVLWEKKNVCAWPGKLNE